MKAGKFHSVQIHSALKFAGGYATKFTDDPAPILAAFASAEKDDEE